jgi:ADP-ribosylglycohydrolase
MGAAADIVTKAPPFRPRAKGNDMRIFTVLFCLAPMPAFAHFGHLADAAGHDHWIALAAAAAAAAAAAWGMRGRKDEDDISEEHDEEMQEA